MENTLENARDFWNRSSPTKTTSEVAVRYADDCIKPLQDEIERLKAENESLNVMWEKLYDTDYRDRLDRMVAALIAKHGIYQIEKFIQQSVETIAAIDEEVAKKGGAK